MNAEKWIEAILQGKGSVSLTWLLHSGVSVKRLRAIARDHGLKPKGFRVERARAKQLAGLLAEAFALNDLVRAELAQELVAHYGPGEASDTRANESTELASSASTDSARPAALEKALEQARAATERAKKSAAKARRSKQEALAARDLAEGQLAELTCTQGQQARAVADADRRAAQLEARVEELARDNSARDHAELTARLAELVDREESGRRRIAELTSHSRRLADEVEELEGMLPRGQRERRRKQAVSSEPTPATFLPRFSDEFLRCLVDLENEHQRKVFAAIARLLLQGFDYPGLHAKQLKGLGGLWSIRAGEGLRVFLLRDGDTVTLEGACTREEQPTFLKKRREA
ncbi:MAG: hypothetical protein CMJ85_10655 [Planctomycetes bacterium]|nr:hypothetical protein [Planctomycetota bacterium]MDP6425245.1 hypothetical protein [Planctomycetota bacterium]